MAVRALVAVPTLPQPARYILTGAPGAGKTTIIRGLAAAGRIVVAEAATEVIAREQARGIPEPWTDPSFIDAILALQREWQLGAPTRPGEAQFYDRSPVCTYALCVFLGHPVPPTLTRELDRIDGRYRKRVFLIQGLGFVTPTAARRISLADALVFEKIHRDVYQSLGYECFPIAPGRVADRIAAIERAVD